jgi:hypothetical protein
LREHHVQIALNSEAGLERTDTVDLADPGDGANVVQHYAGRLRRPLRHRERDDLDVVQLVAGVRLDGLPELRI